MGRPGGGAGTTEAALSRPPVGLAVCASAAPAGLPPMVGVGAVGAVAASVVRTATRSLQVTSTMSAAVTAATTISVSV